ncbi:MAG: hypothetical protein PHE29_03790 [Tissierellia bacterium]|nr:hypothetical protein [Tissierellia bacterium]MDD4780496.1 hypothetical protein [Tissierellia bacterium]
MVNKTLKKLINTEYKRLLTLIIILIISLVFSALIYVSIGQDHIINMNYNSLNKLPFMNIFIRIMRRNIIYGIIITFITCIGLSKIIYLFFCFISIYYGLSIIYLIKIMQSDRLLLLFTITDYFIFFPLLFYFTYISIIISKYTKKTKNIETISHKFDIIVSSYIKLSVKYLLIVLAYSFIYSFYIIILGRLLVR